MTIAQDLAGKVVVVTGAGRGIGRQIAIGAGQRGAKVALVELIAENLDATVKEISAMGITAKGYKTDISSEGEIIKNFALIEKDFGQIDCLVNNAMIHDPEVVIFDEPTSGLDVITAENIIRLIRDCKEQGKTVIFSSHIMSEVDLLCDDMAIIHKGKMLFNGTMDEYRTNMQAENLTAEFIRIVNSSKEI